MANRSQMRETNGVAYRIGSGLLAILAAAGCDAPDSTPPATQGDDVEIAEAPAAASGDGAARAQSGQAIGCTYPVAAGQSARQIVESYGRDAEMATLYGAEGVEIPGVILWPDNPQRRVEIGFADEARSAARSLRIADGSGWTINGLVVGDSLQRAARINGQPILFYGFEWDYGGNVADLEGRLADLAGCSVFVRMGLDDGGGEIPEALVGERLIRSDAAEVEGVDIVVDEIGIVYPQ